MFHMICLWKSHAVIQSEYCVVQSMTLTIMCSISLQQMVVVSCIAPITLVENRCDVAKSPLAWHYRYVQAGLKLIRLLYCHLSVYLCFVSFCNFTSSNSPTLCYCTTLCSISHFRYIYKSCRM